MSTAARIDELRNKFEENPRRYFAPLANELRKAGSLSEAIALCREFLPKQPEHMSGYIVFGQALYESGDLPEARTVFEQALALDPENLKALRHLGDIAKWEGDTVGARRWYERVLEADPRNDDIAAQLATLATPAYVSRVVPEPPAAPEALPDFASAFTPTPVVPGAIPTPDAAVRAVDFAEATARLWTPDEPSLQHVEAPVPSVEAPAAHASELHNLEAIESAGDDAEPEGEPGSAIEAEAVAVDAPPTVVDAEAMGDDPFGFSETVTEEVPFEEGLIAPEWPDTSALVARIATPRVVSPSLPSAMTPDAVAAFGVESGDPIPVHALDEETHLADMDYPSGLADESSVADAADVVVAVTPGTAADAEAEIGDAAQVEVAVEVEAVAEAEVVAEAQTTAQIPEIDDGFDPLDDAEPQWIVATAPVSSPSTDDELPWLEPAPDREAVLDDEVAAFFQAVTPVDDVVGPVAAVAGEAPDVSALFMDDGYDSDDSVYDSDAGDSEFADVMPEDQPPAFVTETMGELLVSQGFTARAVSVYEELVRRRPYDPVLTSRLTELRERLTEEATPPTPAFPTPAFPTPAFPTASFGARAFGTPAFVGSLTPPFATPLSATPISSPAYDASVFAEELVDRVTARERFTRLASRRVPRRTPPRTAVAVDPLASELASLFGADAPELDDLAARALADAFAPIDELGDLGQALPFEDAMLGGAERVATPVRSATPIATPPVSDPGGLFSFDRFFPDPATSSPSTSAPSSRHTPAPEPTREPTSAPRLPSTPPSVSDDLAQFSAWLKGLGNT